jgi:hypothetical protein
LGSVLAVAGTVSGAAAHATPEPPGLSAPIHAALVRSGAYGHHPVQWLIVGDSIALTLGIGLSQGNRSAYGVNITSHATLGCDLDPTLQIFTSGQAGPATQGCNKWRALWPYLTATVHPQVVALGVGRWEVSDHLYQGHWVHIGQRRWDAHLAADIRHAIGIFRTFGAKVVLFNMPYIDPNDHQPNGLPWAENTPTRVQAYNALVDRVARADPLEVTVVNLNKMLSPHGMYTASIHGVVARWADGIHVTTSGGELLQRQILPVIDRLGLEAEAASGRHP